MPASERFDFTDTWGVEHSFDGAFDADLWRPDARKLIVIISDEDDSSAPDDICIDDPTVAQNCRWFDDAYTCEPGYKATCDLSGIVGKLRAFMTKPEALRVIAAVDPSYGPARRHHRLRLGPRQAAKLRARDDHSVAAR